MKMQVMIMGEGFNTSGIYDYDCLVPLPKVGDLIEHTKMDARRVDKITFKYEKDLIAVTIDTKAR